MGEAERAAIERNKMEGEDDDGYDEKAFERKRERERPLSF